MGHYRRGILNLISGQCEWKEGMTYLVRIQASVGNFNASKLSHFSFTTFVYGNCFKNSDIYVLVHFADGSSKRHFTIQRLLAGVVAVESPGVTFSFICQPLVNPKFKH